MHGRFPDRTETIYTARFRLIESTARLTHAFDMQAGGKPFPFRWQASSLRINPVRRNWPIWLLNASGPRQRGPL